MTDLAKAILNICFLCNKRPVVNSSPCCEQCNEALKKNKQSPQKKNRSISWLKEQD